MKVIALVGCTASGKDSILKEALRIDKQGFIRKNKNTHDFSHEMNCSK